MADIAGGLRNVLPGPLDALMGPYATLAAARTAIPNTVTGGKNYRMGKFAIVGTDVAGYKMYWWPNGYTDAGLQLFVPASSGGGVQYATFSTYADMLASGNPTYLTICRVIADENKGMENTEYKWWPDGYRSYSTTVNDNISSSIVIFVTVPDYETMDARLSTDDPDICYQYTVLEDETQGGFVGHYTHYENELTIFIEQ